MYFFAVVFEFAPPMGLHFEGCRNERVATVPGTNPVILCHLVETKAPPGRYGKLPNTTCTEYSFLVVLHFAS